MFDGELPGAECELLARRLTRDEALRAQWSRYSMIGAALRAERGVALARPRGLARAVDDRPGSHLRRRHRRCRHHRAHRGHGSAASCERFRRSAGCVSRVRWRAPASPPAWPRCPSSGCATQEARADRMLGQHHPRHRTIVLDARACRHHGRARHRRRPRARASPMVSRTLHHAGAELATEHRAAGAPGELRRGAQRIFRSAFAPHGAAGPRGHRAGRGRSA